MVFRAHADMLEVELIRSLYYSVVPTVIMTLAFVLAGSLIAWKTGDALLLGLLGAGVLASAARLAVVHVGMAQAAPVDLAIERARLLQRRFMVVYFAFALILGLFGARAMRLPMPEAHMLMICLLVGYGAGVAAGIGLRPRIAIPSMLVAIVPGIVTSLTNSDVLYWATSVLATAFLAGGIDSVHSRHGRAVKSIGRRITFSMLARRDTLTELPNRLALREWYDENVTYGGEGGPVAVHYLDLNGFKQVNDTHGHPVGDALLVAVGKRIASTIRDADMAVRLGGDEFAVIQCGVAGADDAVLLAQRLQAAIALPFQLDGLRVSISTCIGYVISNDRGDDLEHLLSMADEALYASKRGNRGVSGYDLAPTTIDRQAA